VDIKSAAQTVTIDDDGIAVRVERLSKNYGLWSSPGARLNHGLLRLARHFVPAGIAARIDRKCAAMYHEFHALSDVSFTIGKGESWGVIGVNGSGKSTLLKVISGNLRPSAGRVEVDGKVAILDYSSGLHGGFTGRENVYLKGAIFGMSRREIDRKFASIAEFADIGEFIDQPVKTYSSGMVARLGFAIMAHVEADIVITDEALAVGDAFFVQKSMNHIRSFLKRGTFLFVSHSTNDVVSLCQKAVWLERGRIRAIGPAKEVTDAYLSSKSLEHSRAYLERSGAARGEEAPAVRVAADPAEPIRERAVELKQPRLGELMASRPARAIKDGRLRFVNQTASRNDIEIPEFDPGAGGFGVGGARIVDVTFRDETDAVLSWTVGAEMVRLSIICMAERDLRSPIVGFQVRDRLGQVLFADNTYLTTLERPLLVRNGEAFRTEFEFQLPLLPVGDYGIRVACAHGSSEADNAMLHCIDTALIFHSRTSGRRHGLVGVPMQSIRMRVEGETAASMKEGEAKGHLASGTA
jgi:lipopolysaccharide transport system ATP-binding protein